MKKHYNTPIAKSIVLDTESALLADSGDDVSIDFSEELSGGVGSNKRDIWNNGDQTFHWE